MDPQPQTYDDNQALIINSLKKLESELEDTKVEVKLLKQKESETRAALESMNAQLKKLKMNMYDNHDQDHNEDEGIIEEVGSRSSSRSLSLPGDRDCKVETVTHEMKKEGGKEMQMIKKVKPIVPLLGDLFIFRKKSSKSSSPNSIHNLLYTSYHMYFN